MQCRRTVSHRCLQASGVFVYDAHFPVPLLGRVPAAEALALAAPYGRPALVPGGFAAELLHKLGSRTRLPLCTIPVDLVRQGHTPQQQPGLCSGVAASAAGTLFRASSFSSFQAAMLAHRYLDPRAGAPSTVAAQLVTSVAGAGLAVFAKSPSILWPVPLHEQLVQHATPTCAQLIAVMQVARQVAEPLHGSSCQYCWVVMCHGVHTLCAVLRQNML